MAPRKSAEGALNKATLLLLALVIAFPALAQRQLPPSGETIDVSLVNVDVFVTDRNGQRVTGLTAEDFEIRENGRVQPITNFAEYTSQASTTATTAPNAKRTVVVFVERFSLPEFRTRPLFASIRKTLRSVIRPGDSATVVFWDNGGAYTLQYFTDDLPSLEAAVTEIERQSNGVRGAAELMRRRENFAHFHLGPKVEELKALMRSISDDDGRKIVIFATNDFGLHPTNITDFPQAVARTANEHGITIYPIYPLGLEWTPSSAAYGRPIANHAYDQQILVNQTSALDELAKDTGGLMAAGSTEIVSLLPRVIEDLNSYYSLAYRTPATGTTRSRDIAVKAKNREYTVRSRREYVEKTDVTRMQDRVIANLFRPDGRGSIPVHVELGKIDKVGRSRWSAPLRINLPVNALSTGPDGHGSFSVFVATGGVIGIMSDVHQSTYPFSVDDMSPGQQHITYEITLTFTGATSVVSVGVMDAGSKDFGLKTVDLPAFRADERRLGGE
jgi:VWFA-related protein